MKKKALTKRFQGQVHCPMCTHTVEAEVEEIGRAIRVAPGQKCPRCSATLDVAGALEVGEAA